MGEIIPEWWATSSGISSNWRQTMQDAEAGGTLLPDQRKEILAGAFSESLKRLGGYQYVAETTVLRPLRDRPLYCLFYASRHEKGIAVFRDCQVAALNAQSKTRAAHKVKHEATSSGQSEMFESMHDMSPDDTAVFLNRERATARSAILDLTPLAPGTTYQKLWPLVLSRHVVRLTDVNAICRALRKEKAIMFPTWEDRARVPKDHYTMHKV
ncbi:hypothetical protein IVB30_03280 [Bradyrhizobium sp. 200]|uniref:hypothetical protein n=1 Tax=Bradyrhizobium sp. 200 TaxID=2782665 RepID=UPI001FFF3448|nr:hypothetical protein [Bradyrhizobium sp. 200]UPJ50464.1 hypothetical protein IVB30_03280 [Bradyrhizobium sp. 200]